MNNIHMSTIQCPHCKKDIEVFSSQKEVICACCTKEISLSPYVTTKITSDPIFKFLVSRV